MSQRWNPFSASEIRLLTANPKPPTDPSERECPLCGGQSIRFYYHELVAASRTVGTSYFWCALCRKYTHFSGQPLSLTLKFNDPFGDLAMNEFGRIEGKSDWYGKLDELWDDGTLPQTFVEKEPSRKSWLHQHAEPGGETNSTQAVRQSTAGSWPRTGEAITSRQLTHSSSRDITHIREEWTNKGFLHG